MREKFHPSLVPISFFIVFILALLPMPEWSSSFRPAWVVLILIYWSMYAPERVNLGYAWCLGIITDVLNGTLLGEHALAYLIVTYLVIRTYTQLRMYSLLQQGLFVGLSVSIYLFVLFCVQGFIGNIPRSGFYWSPALSSMLLWPWIFMLIRYSNRRLKSSYSAAR